MLRLHFLERELVVLPALRADASWTHFLDAPLRADLRALAARVPAFLDAVDRLPQRFVHGDACPQNLLVPVGEPESFVAIDWSLIGPAPVGYDLSQLLVGRMHTGQLDVDALHPLLDAVVTAYAAGLADEGDCVPAEVVRRGCVTALVVRSAFSVFPNALPSRPGPAPVPDDVPDDAARTRLTRHLVDLAATLLNGCQPVAVRSGGVRSIVGAGGGDANAGSCSG